MKKRLEMKEGAAVPPDADKMRICPSLFKQKGGDRQSQTGW